MEDWLAAVLMVLMALVLWVVSLVLLVVLLPAALVVLALMVLGIPLGLWSYFPGQERAEKESSSEAQHYSLKLS